MVLWFVHIRFEFLKRVVIALQNSRFHLWFAQVVLFLVHQLGFGLSCLFVVKNMLWKDSVTLELQLIVNISFLFKLLFSR